MNDNIRYYKGIKKCRRISKMSPMKTALYEFEDGKKMIVPVRLCWRHRKKASSAGRQTMDKVGRITQLTAEVAKFKAMASCEHNDCRIQELDSLRKENAKLKAQVAEVKFDLGIKVDYTSELIAKLKAIREATSDSQSLAIFITDWFNHSNMKFSGNSVKLAEVITEFLAEAIHKSIEDAVKGGK